MPSTLTSEPSIWAFPGVLVNSGWHPKMPQAERLIQWVFISSQSWGEQFKMYRQGWRLEKGLPWFVDHLVTIYSTAFALQEGGENIFDCHSSSVSVAVIKYHSGEQLKEGRVCFNSQSLVMRNQGSGPIIHIIYKVKSREKWMHALSVVCLYSVLWLYSYGQDSSCLGNGATRSGLFLPISTY